MARKPKALRITSDDQLGSILDVAEYMRVGRTWLSAVKLRQRHLEEQHQAGELSSLPPLAFAGGKTCAAWVREFVRHPVNIGFAPTAEYRKEPPSHPQDRAA